MARTRKPLQGASGYHGGGGGFNPLDVPVTQDILNRRKSLRSRPSAKATRTPSPKELRALMASLTADPPGFVKKTHSLKPRPPDLPPPTLLCPKCGRKLRWGWASEHPCLRRFDPAAKVNRMVHSPGRMTTLRACPHCGKKCHGAQGVKDHVAAKHSAPETRLDRHPNTIAVPAVDVDWGASGAVVPRDGVRTNASEQEEPVTRKPNAAFMRKLIPSPDLARIVGSEPLPRTEALKKLWAYVKRQDLQDKREKRNIRADEFLRAVFGGKTVVSMFEMTKLMDSHLVKDSPMKLQRKPPHVCPNEQWVAAAMIEKVPEAQTTPGRHRCAICAYVLGYEDGLREARRRLDHPSTDDLRKGAADD